MSLINLININNRLNAVAKFQKDLGNYYIYKIEESKTRIKPIVNKCSCGWDESMAVSHIDYEIWGIMISATRCPIINQKYNFVYHKGEIRSYEKNIDICDCGWSVKEDITHIEWEIIMDGCDYMDMVFKTSKAKRGWMKLQRTARKCI